MRGWGSSYTCNRTYVLIIMEKLNRKTIKKIESRVLVFTVAVLAQGEVALSYESDIAFYCCGVAEKR